MADSALRENGEQSQDGAQHAVAEDHEAADGRMPASIRLLYESRDGRFCLYETAGGHLAAVDSTRFV